MDALSITILASGAVIAVSALATMYSLAYSHQRRFIRRAGAVVAVACAIVIYVIR